MHFSSYGKTCFILHCFAPCCDLQECSPHIEHWLPAFLHISTHIKDTLGFLLPVRRQTYVQVLLRWVILDKLGMTPPAKSSRETTKLAHPVKGPKHNKFLTFYGSVQKSDIKHCHKYAVKGQFPPSSLCCAPGHWVDTAYDAKRAKEHVWTSTTAELTWLTF